MLALLLAALCLLVLESWCLRLRARCRAARGRRGAARRRKRRRRPVWLGHVSASGRISAAGCRRRCTFDDTGSRRRWRRRPLVWA